MTLEVFLRQRLRTAIALDTLGGVAAIVAGLIALFITFWIAYTAIYFGFHWILPHRHQTRLWIAGVFVVLLFIGNARTSRDYLTSYEIGTVDGRAPYTIHVPELGVISNLNFLDPRTVNSLTKVIAQLLFIGPRLLVGAVRLFRRAARMRTIDVAPCATLAGRLRRQRGRVPFTEILASIDEPEAVAALQHLLSLDAVQFLQSAPAGAMLTSKFREELDRAAVA